MSGPSFRLWLLRAMGERPSSAAVTHYPSFKNRRASGSCSVTRTCSLRFNPKFTPVDLHSLEASTPTRAPCRHKPTRYVKVINYENRSPQFPGSFVFGIGVGQKPAIVGGIYSTLRNRRAAFDRGERGNRLYHRRQQ